MLFGIRLSLLTLVSEGFHVPEEGDFEAQKEYTVSREGYAFAFSDWAPMVFHAIRRIFNIEINDYMVGERYFIDNS
jgi:hypothetical protein